jgi:quercetin dioxygenase-like cupin family protein
MKHYWFALFLLIPSNGFAQQPAPKVTTIIEGSVSGQADKKLLWLNIEWPPGAGTPVHTHAGDEYGMVVEGEYAVKHAEGDWQVMKAGQSWHMAEGMVHQGANRSSAPARTMNTFVVDKNKPLVVPYVKP